MPDKQNSIFQIPKQAKPIRPFDKTNWNKCGDVWLRVEDERDVLYTESILVNAVPFDYSTFIGTPKPSVGNGEKWFDGAKDEFFTLDVDMENTIIEGFYQDHLMIKGEYEVTIYLEVE